MVDMLFLTVCLLEILSLSLPNRNGSPFNLGVFAFFLSALLALYFLRIFLKFFGCAVLIMAT